jgi:hypothetical protein
MTSPPANSRWLGVALPKIPNELEHLDQFARIVGQRPTILNWYEPWWWKATFPAAKLDAMTAAGGIPQVTWEPWDPNLGPTQVKHRVSEMATPAHYSHAYVKSWADAIYAWRKPIRIRLAHEMNYGRYPWAVGRNLTTPSDHMGLWLRVQAIFAQAKTERDALDVAAGIAPGPDLVRWIWCVQTPFPGTASIEALFPSDYAVNEVQLDGYNWALNGGAWNSFSGVFKRGIAELTQMTSKPITIGETGCPEIGGDKAAWIRDMWSTLAGWPQVRGLLWFHWNKEADWRVDSSVGALDAFRAGLPGFLAT